jgi:hypothetical protein
MQKKKHKSTKPTTKTAEKPGRACADPEQCEDPTRNDFNEEQMSTDTECGPVETDPVSPRDDVKSGHIPGVAVS